MSRASTTALVVAVLVWPAYLLGWMPVGLSTTAFASALSLALSYLCYRRVRVRLEAEQIERLRTMQRREGLSDEELLSYVALHHPNLNQFGKSLAEANNEATKREVPS